MPVYVAREAPKLWTKICAETSIEVSLLFKNWKYLLAGIVFQYVHGLAAHGVHYLHRPGPTLQDTGFFLLPELGPDKAYMSETLFTILFSSFVLWTFNPFFFQSKRIYTVLIWCRVLAYLAVSQILRIMTFYSTQLPGPNYHCREGSNLARLPPPKSALEVLLINFPHGVIYGCGDLIFSSHMIFTLVFVRTYQKYGTKSWWVMEGNKRGGRGVWGILSGILRITYIRCIKQFAWVLAMVQSLLIIASRKHYTVDIVVAWYAVNLVAFFVDNKLPALPDRSAGSTAPQVLPLSTKDKDSRKKEELQRFINGNSADATD